MATTLAPRPLPHALWLGALCLLGLAACEAREEAAPAVATAPESTTAPAAAPPALALPPGADEAAGAITGEYLREVVTVLSDDTMEGRAPGSAGDEAARKYIVEQLTAAGAEPAGPDGSWEQKVEIVALESAMPESWTFRAAEGQELALTWWQEYVATSGVQNETIAIEDAELVFVGYGIEAPEYQWDDFKGRDLKGKILVLLNSDPDWDPALFEGERRLYYGRWTYKYESAARQGAAGAIILHTTPSAGYPWQVVQTGWSGEQFELPAGDEPRTQVTAWITEEAAAKLFALGGQDLANLMEAARSRDFQPVDLKVRTSLAVSNKIRRDAVTANVLGRLPGSDPELADEVVIYTAHHDHLGRGQANAEGDDIYNGAQDNATGVAQVLAVARAFAALPKPPRRSILFALVAAEEQGLLGSEYFAAHPTVPPGKIAANVNFDAANIFGRTRDLTFIGYGKSSLDPIVEAAAARQDRVVVGDQFPDRGFFYRSDQFSLAKIGVPAIYVDGGTDLRDKPAGEGQKLIEDWEANHYHQPSDEISDWWSWDGMVEDAAIGFMAGLAVAEADALPTWKPGDEFEAARQAALAAVSEGPGP